MGLGSFDGWVWGVQLGVGLVFLGFGFWAGCAVYYCFSGLGF